MKSLFMVTLLLLVAGHAFAQWNPNNQTTGNIYYNGGNVGIGTDEPIGPLHISGSVSELNLLIHNTSTNGARTFLSDLPGKSSIQTDKDFTIATNYNGWNDRFILTHSGKVGIGILAPTEMLSVNGAIHMPLANSTDNDSPGIVAVSDDDFLYDGQYINHYGFGFHNYNDGHGYDGINSYVAGFFGFDVFTKGIPRLRINSNGNVGIGTTIPNHKLEVVDFSGEASFGLKGSFDTKIVFQPGDGSHRFTIWSDMDPNTYNDLLRFGATNAPDILNLKGNGNVGIGTTNPTQKLTVNGTIYSTEVKVDVNAGTGPDYVFEPTYQLPTLAEIESYIKANKHLPEVPSAKEMETNGVNLSEMNMLLLKKVEELTLHLIRIEKENELQRNEINELKSNRKK